MFGLMYLYHRQRRRRLETGAVNGTERDDRPTETERPLSRQVDHTCLFAEGPFVYKVGRGRGMEAIARHSILTPQETKNTPRDSHSHLLDSLSLLLDSLSLSPSRSLVLSVNATSAPHRAESTQRRRALRQPRLWRRGRRPRNRARPQGRNRAPRNGKNERRRSFPKS